MALKLTGPLNNFREPRRLGLLASEEDKSERYVAWATEDFENLNLLCAHFGLSDGPDKYYLLALRLASEAVPCFQEKSKEGRPKKWTEFELGVLAVETERITTTGVSRICAAAILARRAPWKGFLEGWGNEGINSIGKDPAAALMTAYKSAKAARFTSVVRGAFKYHEANNTISEWDKTVLSVEKENNSR